MKMKHFIITAWLVCLTLGLTPIVITGCKNPQTQQTIVFNTFKTSWTVSKAAYDGWCERVVLGKVTADKEANVDAAWNKYRASFKVAFNIAIADWSAPTPSALTAAQTELINLIRSFSN